MKNIVSAIALAFSLLLAVSCQPRAYNDASSTASISVGDGDLCGGIGALKCSNGFFCANMDHTHSDASGICVKNVEPAEGQMCGGFAGIVCKEGLRCITKGSHTDASGVCMDFNGQTEGAMCGGFAGITCGTGLRCKNQAAHPDATGVCQRDVAGFVASQPNASLKAKAGQLCGGIAGFVCGDGLTCVGKSSQPDSAGVCADLNVTGERGSMCGGFMGITCAASLKCKKTQNFPDASGVCVK